MPCHPLGSAVREVRQHNDGDVVVYEPDHEARMAVKAAPRPDGTVLFGAGLAPTEVKEASRIEVRLRTGEELPVA